MTDDKQRSNDIEVALLSQKLDQHIEDNNRSHAALDKKIDGAIGLIGEVRTDVRAIGRLMMGWQAAVLVAVLSACGGLLWYIVQHKILWLPSVGF